jgi:hypothetical protein
MSARSSRSISTRGGYRDQVQSLPEPFSPIEHRRRVEIANLPVEQAILIAIGGDEASGMPVRQIGHQFGHHLEADEKAVQRVLVELVGAGEQFVEQRILPLHVADEKRLGELILVLEMIEEAALGDPDRGDHLLDRSGGEPLLEHGRLDHIENALACIAAFARRLLHASLLRVFRLYHGST